MCVLVDMVPTFDKDHKQTQWSKQFEEKSVNYPIYICTLPSEVLFTLGELYPCQTGQPRLGCLGEDLGEGQV